MPGLGGKKLSHLYHELGVVDKDTLLQEAENGHIEALKGFGKKSAEKWPKQCVKWVSVLIDTH